MPTVSRRLAPPQDLPRAPVWVRRPQLFQTSTPVVIGLALTVEAVLLLPREHALAAAAGILLTVAGVWVGHGRPGWGLGLVCAAPVATASLGAEPIVLWTTSVFAAFLFVLRGLSGPVSALVVAVGNAAAAAIAAGTVSTRDPVPLIAALCGVVAVAVAAAIRGQRLYWTELDRSTREAVAGRAAAIERGIAEERVRIARDLHDLVGHEIAVVSMHLGAAEVHLPAGADAPRGHLITARAGVQSLLVETQEILRVLHTGHDGDPTAPTASHTRVPDLVDSFRTAGMTIDADLGGLPTALPLQVSVAAYRIVQESLTNAQRHGTGPVRLRLTSTATTLEIEVQNAVDPTRTPGPTQGSGRGLVGMRERATAAGGRLHIDRDVARLTVRAVLPATQEAHR
jgi:signal transduction histidine kinase